MIARLEFNLDDPSDEGRFRYAMNGEKWYAAIVAFDDFLRSQIKYHDRVDLQPIRTELRSHLDWHGLTLEEVV